MRRKALILAVLATLAIPMLAAADDQGWRPPEWTPTPPARPRQARAWTWEEIDNNPVRRAGRSGGN